jgi:hypothetical protein
MCQRELEVENCFPMGCRGEMAKAHYSPSNPVAASHCWSELLRLRGSIAISMLLRSPPVPKKWLGGQVRATRVRLVGSLEAL